MGTTAPVDEGERRARLERLDALAADLMARAAPVRFGVAASAGEIEEVHRLRGSVVVERGWARPEELPGGIERDVHDDGAVHIAGRDGPVLVAAARLVFPAPGRQLPTEETFGLIVEPRGRVANADRIVVARASSDGGHRVLAGLLARCWLELRARGFSVWAGVDSPAMIRLYRRLGFRVTPLGAPRRYWAEERVPVRFDPLEAADEVFGRWGHGLSAGEEASHDGSGTQARLPRP